MTDEIIEEIRSLSARERTIIGSFETRIRFLYDHRKQLKSIARHLKDGKTQKAHGEAHALADRLAETFASLELPEDCFKQARKALEDESEYTRTFDEYIKDLPGKVPKRVHNDLARILAMEEEEEELIDAFRENLSLFREHMQLLRERVAAEIRMLRGSLDKVTPKHLTYYERQVEKILKEEKELIHEPMERLAGKANRGKRLSDKLKGREQIGEDDIKKDLKTFSRPDEALKYQKAVLKHTGLTPRARRFLEKIDVVAFASMQKQFYNSRKFWKMAFLDQLTRIHNRRHIIRHMRRIIADTDRSQGHFSVLMLDIDHFKSFNDIYGHEVGDAVLQKVAQLLQEAVRENDIALRWGGEEFLIVLNKTDKHQGITTAERIRERIEQGTKDLMKDVNAATGEVHRTSVTVSIGVATYPDDHTHEKERRPVDILKELREKADDRLYRAKKSGRNRVV